mmetsp:Transcript_9677/g.10750  ORF Transcript_9677/g.10750 Transcript_9677/m.10750 type:complete len:213 (+) Transcript_9677:50-688(+)
MERKSYNGSSCIFIFLPLLLMGLIVYQVTYNQSQLALLQQQYYLSEAHLNYQGDDRTLEHNSYSRLPLGDAVPLPSIRNANKKNESDRQDIYGGKGDSLHLGGFTKIDHMGLSPTVWRYMIEMLGVRSLLDVGCGRGISTSWFIMHGLADTTLCVEGSHDAYEKSILPSPQTQMVEHDFSRGPWWPSRTFDAVWCVEFLEHVRADKFLLTFL